MTENLWGPEENEDEENEDGEEVSEEPARAEADAQRDEQVKNQRSPESGDLGSLEE